MSCYLLRLVISRDMVSHIFSNVGKIFRLRSVRWPRYEVGCITRDLTAAGVAGGNTGGDNFLVLYEWNPKRFVRAPVKWVYNDTWVNPLQVVVLDDTYR